MIRNDPMGDKPVRHTHNVIFFFFLLWFILSNWNIAADFTGTLESMMQTWFVEIRWSWKWELFDAKLHSLSNESNQSDCSWRLQTLYFVNSNSLSPFDSFIFHFHHFLALLSVFFLSPFSSFRIRSTFLYLVVLLQFKTALNLNFHFYWNSVTLLQPNAI